MPAACHNCDRDSHRRPDPRPAEPGGGAGACCCHGRDSHPLSRSGGGDGRPFLGGSPSQIAEDLARLEPAGVDEVFFSNQAATDLDTEVRLLEELRAAAAAG